MCEHEILIMNYFGYVARCNSCKRYQLAFGTALFAFNPFQMKMFKDNLRMEQVLNANLLNPEKKCIQIHTFTENGAFVLNTKEAGLLEDLLSEAAHMERLKKILEINNIQTT